MTNTEENRKLMLPITKTKVEGMEVTALVDTGASASFLQTEGRKQNAIEIYTNEEAYQVGKATGQDETISKKKKTNVEIAR